VSLIDILSILLGIFTINDKNYLQESYPTSIVRRFCKVLTKLNPDAQKTGLGILGIQGCSLSRNWHWSAIKGTAQVGGAE
jgi:hypothetical protein